jgi:uncharacterized protein (TIGR03066 family)
MKTLRWLAVAAAVCLVGGVARAEDDLAKMLVGKWVVTKSEEGAPPVGTVAEFAKDGTLKVTMKKDDKDATMEGTYKCEAKKFICTFKTGDKEQTMTHDVSKISDDEMTFTFEGKSVTAKKKS